MPPLGQGGQRRLQPHGVVGLAVSHQTIAGSIHKEGLGLGGEIQLQGLVLGLHLHRIGGAGQQGEQGKYIGVAGLVHRLAVQGNGKGVCRTVAQFVFQLENGADATRPQRPAGRRGNPLFLGTRSAGERRDLFPHLRRRGRESLCHGCKFQRYPHGHAHPGGQALPGSRLHGRLPCRGAL
mgnify:CR=1 FL=1